MDGVPFMICIGSYNHTWPSYVTARGPVKLLLKKLVVATRGGSRNLGRGAKVAREARVNFGRLIKYS